MIRAGETPMKLPFILAVAASTILVGVPLAHALQVESSSVPAATAPHVADPDEIMKNMDNRASGSGSAVTPFGNSLHFGTSTTTNGGSSDGNGLFLESPASRTVPSQAR
jgi:hypothetical protein